MAKINATLVGSAALSLLLGTSVARGAEPLAIADGEYSGTRVEITHLERTSGDTVTLRFTLVNESGARVNPYGLFGRSDVREVHLIDAVGKKKYLVITDGAGNCVCSTRLPTALDPDKSLNLWARLPAPPNDVKVVGVVIPRFIPAEVAITN